MLLSVRTIFDAQDEGWTSYREWLERPILTEVRTIDCALNVPVFGGNNIFCLNVDLYTMVNQLPQPASSRQYCLLAVNLTNESEPANSQLRLLGYDLSDETMTSSLLNCGPWVGRLSEISARSNRYGLLSLDDARLSQEILPEEWGDEEPHSRVDIWALYEFKKNV